MESTKRTVIEMMDWLQSEKVSRKGDFLRRAINQNHYSL